MAANGAGAKLLCCRDWRGRQARWEKAMTDALAGKVASPKAVLTGSAPLADDTEGMSYLQSLPRRLVTVGVPGDFEELTGFVKADVIAAVDGPIRAASRRMRSMVQSA